MKTNVWAKAARRKGFTVKEFRDSRAELLENNSRWMKEVEDLLDNNLPGDTDRRLGDLWDEIANLSRNATELSDEERRALSQAVNSVAGAQANYREGDYDESKRDLKDVGRSLAELGRMFKNNAPTSSGSGFGSSRTRY